MARLAGCSRGKAAQDRTQDKQPKCNKERLDPGNWALAALDLQLIATHHNNPLSVHVYWIVM